VCPESSPVSAKRCASSWVAYEIQFEELFPASSGSHAVDRGVRRSANSSHFRGACKEQPETAGGRFSSGEGRQIGYAEIAKAPENARSKRNPFENDADAVTAGRKLFEQHCAECHGNMAVGGKKGPSLREEEVQRASPGALFWVLTNGVVRRGMPVWSKVPEPQRWQIVSFLKSLRETEHVSSLKLPINGNVANITPCR
jgi:mono/diheme cytochrome c family protein